jgi:hypothetical protein
MTLRVSLLSKKDDCNFFGKVITLNPSLGLFATFNPFYRGRSELPDNLK